jgi:hypothetical protein
MRTGFDSSMAEETRVRVYFCCRLTFVLVLLVSMSLLHAQELAMESVSEVIRREILENWKVVASPEAKAFTLRSPSYRMRHGDGCVRHFQVFPVHGSEVYFAGLEFYSRYAVDLGKLSCVEIEADRYFKIEGNDVVGVLDFVRKILEGVDVGRDSYEVENIPRLSECFSSKALSDLHILQARSEWHGPQGSLNYRVVLRCDLLESSEEIIVSGDDGIEGINWSITPSRPLDVARERGRSELRAPRISSPGSGLASPGSGLAK